jgi:hypothetical protein
VKDKLRELGLVILVAVALTTVMTWPLVPNINRLGRVDNADGQLSIWNVSWVARTLVVDPLHVFDANIFYPHTRTLAYSESNLGAGVLAIPAYWATRNPFTAHNAAVLLGFVLSFVGTFYVVHFLTCDRDAALVSATCFAFTPFVFAHSAHIQLQMTAGLPFSMFLFHRFTERISPGRGAALGAVMAATALLCGYYGVFAILMVGYAAIVVAISRRLVANLRYWLSLATGALVALVIVTPAFLPYARMQRVEGFHRDLEQARQYSSSWSDYFASSAHAHVWMLPHLPPWTEVVFPGFVAMGFGVAGFVVARKRHRGEFVAIYGGLALLACWASFGPAGGLYTVLYRTVPLFQWLRAPARFGVIVAFALSVLAGATIADALRRLPRRVITAAVLLVLAAAELLTTSSLREMNGFEPVYRMLATLPAGAVIEMPFYYLENMFPLHAKYMLNSTTHWKPIVNGYSDYIPPDFVTNVMTLAPFPTPESLKLLQPSGVRYAVIHLYGYNESNRRDEEIRLNAMRDYLRLLYEGEDTRLYEILGTPP